MLTTPLGDPLGGLGEWTAGPFLVACALLVFSGATKVVHPSGTRLAARAIGLPSSRLAVVALAIVEIGLGVGGAAFGRAVALGVAACYALLTFTVVRLLRRAPTVPCGCLGSSSSTASPTHVVVNGVAAVAATLAATQPAPLDGFSGGPVAVVALGVLLALSVSLVELVVGSLPELDRLTSSGST
jgi:hypothetical protein